MQVGQYPLRNRLALAPMAGVTDRPFRQLCKSLGAGYAVSEMVASDPRLRHTPKSRRRRNHEGEVAPVAVQIAGADPVAMAEAARFNVDEGAQIIDINMGCPAKKVCNVAAGSALLRDEALVARIVESVVAAVEVPVTLKIRTGWDRASRNAVRVARIAEAAGVHLLAVHGRTRADLYEGSAEYDTIAAVKAAVCIPVLANGDVDSPRKALEVLARTGADGVMIGRAAQGRPWIFREIDQFLREGTLPPPPPRAEIHGILRSHVQALHAFYGELAGVRMARKHVGWTARALDSAEGLRQAFNVLTDAEAQLRALDDFFLDPERFAALPEALAA
ncbi:MAG: tRNA dihydrouridine synthase DusB [Betaproteobacteria bacterium]|jgi:tRNA-dihydrouridine synthase B|nr:tRNA dihydrouridine synthase DusB [Rhodocyclaceae bacterium]MCA3134067.1 tRNA dihydrouridine synthase DusB [Rhodocyclaceae bacterium]MCA3142641.1 tRNA dihydrouridine synthase DusB [Rhodocyclaceae bacterium]MCA3144390.1 tRNA dihydrouridine synthase DusB [Rhodocyclaceae bacterium]MCE2897454.1 tRNA dihydrouridine synthase DusB [Betaproteobacteria bacterium]